MRGLAACSSYAAAEWEHLQWAQPLRAVYYTPNCSSATEPALATEQDAIVLWVTAAPASQAVAIPTILE